MQLRNSLDYFVKRMKSVDKVVLIITLVIFGIGVLTIFSTTGISTYNNRSGDSMAYVRNTIIFGIVAIIGMLFLFFLPYKTVKNFLAPAAVIGTLGLLLLTAIIGHGTFSNPRTERWITLAGFTFQPAEFARLGMAVAFPWIVQYLVDRKKYFTDKFWAPNLLALLYVIACGVLILGQPDLGSTMVVAGMGAIMFFCSGVGKKQFIVFGILAALGLFTILSFSEFIFQGYQLQRLGTWFDPFNDPRGLQNVMGFTSIALGGMFGVGLGNSMLKYGFAIEPQTDFIITIIAEELGTMTVLLIMIGYFTISVRCFLAAFKGKDMFSSLTCIGVGAFFLLQPLVNLGGVIGLLPLSGVTLPLVSFGGTSLIATFLMIGIYLNMRSEIMKKPQVKLKETKSKPLKSQISKKILPFKKVK